MPTSMTVTGWPLPVTSDRPNVPTDLNALAHAIQKGTVLVTDTYANLDAKLAADSPPITGTARRGLVAYRVGADELAVCDGTTWQPFYRSAGLVGNLSAKTAGQYAAVDGVVVAKLPRGRYGAGGAASKVSDGGIFTTTEPTMLDLDCVVPAPAPRRFVASVAIRLQVSAADTVVNLRLRSGSATGTILAYTSVTFARAGIEEATWTEEVTLPGDTHLYWTAERAAGSGSLQELAGSRGWVWDMGAAS
jgi:hypothetical protein